MVFFTIVAVGATALVSACAGYLTGRATTLWRHSLSAPTNRCTTPTNRQSPQGKASGGIPLNIPSLNGDSPMHILLRTDGKKTVLPGATKDSPHALPEFRCAS